MNYEELSNAGKRLTIETRSGGDRVSAHLFLVPGGFVYADLGWDEPLGGGHPFHLVECEFTTGGYTDKDGNVLDIYVDDKPTPDRGSREKCWERIKEFLVDFNVFSN